MWQNSLSAFSVHVSCYWELRHNVWVWCCVWELFGWIERLWTVGRNRHPKGKRSSVIMDSVGWKAQIWTSISLIPNKMRGTRKQAFQHEGRLCPEGLIPYSWKLDAIWKSSNCCRMEKQTWPENWPRLREYKAQKAWVHVSTARQSGHLKHRTKKSWWPVETWPHEAALSHWGRSSGDPCHGGLLSVPSMGSLTSRAQVVKIGNHRSSTLVLNTDTPQGRVLNPAIFTLY